MEEKVTTMNQCGAWRNQDKVEDWHDDYKSKVYVSHEGWYWVGLRKAEKKTSKSPDVELKLRPMSDAEASKYCGDIRVLTPDQARAKWGAKNESPGSNRSRNDKELDDDIPF